MHKNAFFSKNGRVFVMFSLYGSSENHNNFCKYLINNVLDMEYLYSLDFRTTEMKFFSGKTIGKNDLIKRDGHRM